MRRREPRALVLASCPAQFIELFEKFYGPTMNAVDAARKKRRKEQELHRQLIELANAQNKSGNTGTLIPATSCALFSANFN